MNRNVLLAVAVTTVGLARAQEPKLGLNGIFDIGSTNSRYVTRIFPDPAVTSHAREFDWGLDLNVRTYILDPRFISLTLEPSIHRGTGRADAQQDRNADTGGAFYLDFLKERFFPFRFHFIDHSLSYEQEHLSNANVARRSIGFDWTLRKPKRPPVFVNYDQSRFDYEFSLAPRTVTRMSSLLVATRADYKGWETNAGYSHQSSTQAFTDLGTATDLIRGTANRKLWSTSQLSTTALYESLRLANEPGRPSLNLPFTSIRTDLRMRPSEKLSTMVFHQYYRTGIEVPVASPGVGGGRFEVGSTAFNDFGGQASYRVLSPLTIGGSTSAAFVSTPATSVETVARTISVSANIAWERKIKFIQTRASRVQGLSSVSSSMGHSRQVPFDTSTAGLSVGDPRRLLLSADGQYSRRPDLFEIGGHFTQENANGAFETAAARLFRLRASAGIGEFDYVTLRGRERFHIRNYSASVSRSIITLTVSRNSDLSFRNLLLTPTIGPQQLFVTLPVDSLINASLSGTAGVYTLGSLTLRPRKRFEFEARYLRQRMLFTKLPGVLFRQYEAYGSYRLGKFTFSAGVLYFGDSTQDVAHRLRRYYFFRIARPFRIF